MARGMPGIPEPLPTSSMVIIFVQSKVIKG